MSEQLHFQMSEGEGIKAVQEYVNRRLFKKPLTLLSMMKVGTTYSLLAEPAPVSPREAKSKRAHKHGINPEVLGEQPAQPNGSATEEANG